jgi:hypothetical protein
LTQALRWFACAALAPLCAAGGQRAPAATLTFLGQPLPLNRGENAALARGDAVVRVLKTADRRDVILLGVVAINVPRAFFARRMVRVAAATKRAGRTAAGVFATPATVSDVSALAVTRSDVALLRACKVGSCDFKLPVAEMEHVRAIIDSTGDAAPTRVSAYARQGMVAFVNAYREHGGGAMPTYDDFGSGGVKGSAAFDALAGESPSLRSTYPAVHERITAYPAAKAGGDADVIYWARDEAQGLRPTVTINHLSVFTLPAFPGTTVATTRQLYADHYFEAGIELLVATDGADSAGTGGIRVMTMQRYRFDHLPSGWVLNLRGRVVGDLTTRAAAELRRVRADYQAAFAQGRGGAPE